MTRSKSYFIGIDTGGTYTDAVLIDANERRILFAEKAITTKGNLAEGVGEALSKVLQAAGKTVEARQITTLALSTTLATNAVVEGHGSPCGVILIGFDQQMALRTGIATAFPGMPVAHIDGGHNHNGEELAPLDEVMLRQVINEIDASVSAYSISSAFAVRNAAHEVRAGLIVAELTAKPVTLSTEIATALDAPRRALTATLNARLIGNISRLIVSVQQAASAIGLTCPVMVVRGDGSLASAHTVRARPIETVLSGPAASLIGAKWLSGLDDFIMSDIGGTTTDIGLLIKGRPKIAEDGAMVGGWRTMVRAIDINTIGLGGDSEVTIGTNGALQISQQRALPISLLAARRPETLALLAADLAETNGASLHGKFVVRPFGGATGLAPHGLSKLEQQILEKVVDQPVPLRRIAVAPQAQRAVQSLRRKGLIQFAAFTPSDAAHVLNLQSNWNRKAAEIAAQMLYRFRTMALPDEAVTQEFCREIWLKTVTLSTKAILASALGEHFRQSDLIDAVSEGQNTLNYAGIQISPTIPIVAVGGPAKVYYPEVAKRLNCALNFTEHFSVANAVGAAVGRVMHNVEATVEGDGQGVFRVYCDGHASVHSSAKAAIDDAVTRVRTSAYNRALAFGAIEPIVTHSVEKHMLPDAVNDDGLMSAIVRAEAAGRVQ